MLVDWPASESSVERWSNMYKRLPWKLTGILLLSLLHAHGEERAFTVRDSIEMTTFSNPSSLINGSGANISPDEKHFLVVTSRGIIKTDEVESTLWEFYADEIRDYLRDGSPRKPPVPKLLVRIAAIPRRNSDRANAPLIGDLRWSTDSHWIYFLGDDSNGHRRLYRVHPDGKHMQLISQEGTDVASFDFVNDTVAYVTSRTASSSDLLGVTSSYPINEDSRAVTGLPLDSILFPIPGVEPQVSSLWVWRNSRQGPIQNRVGSFSVLDRDDYSKVFSISPNGRYVIWSLPVDQLPSSWNQYSPPVGFENRRINSSDPDVNSPFNANRPREYTLVNLQSGERMPLVEAPQGSALLYGADVSEVIWSASGDRVILTNTFLPMEGIDDLEHIRRERPCAAASIDLPSREAHCVVFTAQKSVATLEDPAQLRLVDVSLLSPSEVLLDLESAQNQEVFQRYVYTQPDGWIASGKPTHRSPSNSSLNLIVKESLNKPPALWAKESTINREKLLWDPDPELGPLRMGEASLYRWTGKDQHKWEAVLIKPVDYVRGRRYPLVIQTHGFAPDRFITDGQFPTAMAARPLASAGIMVLQIGHRSDHLETQQEVEDQIDEIESAIHQLTADELIEPTKVGIIGFSRTCWYVERALIERPQLIAAATIADGVDYGYMQYMLFSVGRTIVERSYEKVNGGKPFGSDLKRWIQDATGFHLETVRTPLRIEALGSASLLQEWEIYSALRQQGKPVDLIYIPDGQHILQKPLERLASQQGNVDWFCFWLKGEQDPDPAKQKQYANWKMMRH
jgi:dipeptidyl aminopeptidase/acylaminoacyl peptidase